MAGVKAEMPDFFDPNNPDTWVKEDPNSPGESVAVAVLGSAGEEGEQVEA